MLKRNLNTVAFRARKNSMSKHHVKRDLHLQNLAGNQLLPLMWNLAQDKITAKTSFSNSQRISAQNQIQKLVVVSSINNRHQHNKIICLVWTLQAISKLQNLQRLDLMLLENNKLLQNLYRSKDLLQMRMLRLHKRLQILLKRLFRRVD